MQTGLSTEDQDTDQVDEAELMEKLEELLKEMDLIQIEEYKAVEGSYYIWRAR